MDAVATIDAGEHSGTADLKSEKPKMLKLGSAVSIMMMVASAAMAQQPNMHTPSSDDEFTDCLVAEMNRNPQYISTDGGRSAVLLMSHCKLNEWVERCEAAGGGTVGDCRVKAAILAQTGLKLREAGVR